MGKVCTLNGFNLLYPASCIREENTGPVGMFNQGQALPVPGQPGIFINELMTVHAQKMSNGVGFIGPEPYITRFPAAGMALDALKIIKV